MVLKLITIAQRKQNILYFSAACIWAGHVARMGEKRGAFRLLVEKSGRRGPLGRPRFRWKDNIKMDLQEMGWDMDWIELSQDKDRWRAVVNAVMNLRVS